MRARPFALLVLLPFTGCGTGAVATSVPQPPHASAALPEAGRPPPVHGGSLLVTNDERRAVLSDPDRDALVVIDLERGLRVLGVVPLERGDLPGRLALDSGGRVHAALRGGGAIVSIDPENAVKLSRRAVCAEPRGMAWHAGQLLVACAGGELMAMSEHSVEKVGELEPDLRDVVVDADGRAHVTRYRSAELIDAMTETRLELSMMRFPITPRDDRISAGYDARVAWRATAASGAIWIAHQRHLTRELETPFEEYYGGFVNPTVVKSAIARVERGHVDLIPLASVSLPVDIAVDPRSDLVAVADGTQPLIELTTAAGNGRLVPLGDGLAVAVAWVGRNVLVQLRQPSVLALVDPDRSLVIASLGIGEPSVDYGHAVFHGRQSSGVACASCHPEAGDDGFVWDFAGRRVRTPSLAGGVMDTAPFHWNGEHTALSELMTEVFTERMGGPELQESEVGELGRWLNAEPPIRAVPVDPGAVERGRAMFSRAGCDACHSGLHFTDNRNHDVGSGGFFQTPTLLGLRVRAPYFHDGCAMTIAERFGRCHTEGHGAVEDLGSSEIRDLIAFLETL